MNAGASEQSPTVAGRQVAPLLQREEDLARLNGLVAGARAGEGTVALIEGAAGIGKTRLLGELHTRARSLGFLVLAARGAEIEREFAFGLVRQAFEPWLAHAGERERTEVMSGAARFTAPVFAEAGASAPPDADPGYAVLHGLYWLCANLAVRQPLLLSFDDAHWIDLPTLRFVSFLGRRLEGMNALVVLAARPGEPGTGPATLSALVVELDLPILRPEPLSQAATASVIRSQLGRDVGAELCTACHEVSAGNPFLIAELIRELEAQDRELDQIPADWVRRLGPERIAQSVLMRIGRLSPEAVRLAWAIAVLGGEAHMRHAAQLAGLSLTGASPIVDSLVEAAVLDRSNIVGFVHPLVRAAVYKDIPAGERARLHAAAASLLAEEGATAERVAVHLLTSEPDGQPWVVETLRRAADAALARGTPEPAVAFLRRALAEPPTPPERVRLLLDLGSAEFGAGDPAALEHLSEAVAAGADEQERAAAALQLGRALNAASRSAEAVAIFERSIEELGDRDQELALWLEGELLGTAWYEASTQPLILPRVGRLR
ncbi:MAG: AAA family ATPase, partial [Solirubrobacterales bacterium]